MMSKERIVTSIYSGPTHAGAFSRPIETIEQGIGRGTLDLEEEICAAIEFFNNKHVSLLDLGSGSGAALLSLTNPDTLPVLLKQLQRTKVELHLLGLTDCPRPERFNEEDEWFRNTFDAIPRPGFGSGKNIFYTISATQSLEAFLDTHCQNPLTFILASQSLMYFSARLFGRTIDTMMERLAPNGRILIWGTGSHVGPLPAFTGATAEYFRSAVTMNETLAELLNPFAIDGIPYAQMAGLVRRSGWRESTSKLSAYLEKAHTSHSFEITALQEKFVEQQLSTFATKQQQHDSYQGIQHDDMKEALTLYVRLHPWIHALREAQYKKQVGLKQAYLEQLSERQGYTTEVVHTRPLGNTRTIDGILIRKHASRRFFSHTSST